MFITASYVFYPTDPKSTSKPGFSKDPSNYIADEVVSLVKKLRDNDLKRCNVILNVKRKEVIKCRNFQLNGKLVEKPDYDTLLEHFKEMYPEPIEKLLEFVQA